MSAERCKTISSLDRQALLERARGAYLGLALGDALGATAEFMTPGEICAVYGTLDEIRGGGWLRLQPGQVTDDTTMSLALGDAILAHGRVEAPAVAEAFSQWMRSKPIDVGHTVRRGIIRFRGGGAWCAPYDEYGAGNGACMRCLPVALAGFGLDRHELRRWALAQARVTHHNRLSDAATCFVVELIQAGLVGGHSAPVHAMVHAWVSEYPEFNPAGRRQLNPSGYVVDTLRAVLQSLLEHEQYEPCLVDIVNRGGDSDTTGAIAGAICGALYGAVALPSRWLEVLDAGVRERCEVQAGRLIDLALARAKVAH